MDSNWFELNAYINKFTTYSIRYCRLRCATGIGQVRARDREIERENEGANETFTLQFESAVGALHQFINVSKVNTYIIHWWQQTSATLY